MSKSVKSTCTKLFGFFHLILQSIGTEVPITRYDSNLIFVTDLKLAQLVSFNSSHGKIEASSRKKKLYRSISIQVMNAVR